MTNSLLVIDLAKHVLQLHGVAALVPWVRPYAVRGRIRHLVLALQPTHDTRPYRGACRLPAGNCATESVR